MEIKEFTVKDEINAWPEDKKLVEPVNVDKQIFPKPVTVDCSCCVEM